MITADYITNNMAVFTNLVRLGVVCANQLTYYSIYQHFKSIPQTSGKMDRYYITARAMSVSVATVRNAVKIMSESLPKSLAK